MTTSPTTSVNGRGRGKPRLFRRGLWENGSAAVIALGILMLMQPFALELYTWSFVVLLLGAAGFLITSHFPE
jgi:hypothetical protein